MFDGIFIKVFFGNFPFFWLCGMWKKCEKNACVFWKMGKLLSLFVVVAFLCFFGEIWKFLEENLVENLMVFNCNRNFPCFLKTFPEFSWVFSNFQFVLVFLSIDLENSHFNFSQILYEFFIVFPEIFFKFPEKFFQHFLKILLRFSLKFFEIFSFSS